MTRPWLFLLLALVASLAVSRGALAQASDPDGPTADEVNRIAKKLYCPVCPNTPLDVVGLITPTQGRRGWRGARSARASPEEQGGGRAAAQAMQVDHDVLAR